MCRRCLYSIVFVAAAMVPAPALAVDGPADVRQWVEAIDTVELRGPGIDAKGKTYSVGHLTVQFGSGKLFPVVARDSIVGMFFSGEAQFTYTSGDPLELANFRTNVRRVTRYRVKESSVSDSINAILIWDPDRARVMPGDQEWPEGQASDEDAARFYTLRKRCSEDWGFPPELFLAHMLVQPADVAPAVVQIQAAKHDLLYVYDTLRDQEEGLYSLDKVEGGGYEVLRGMRYLELLSNQPIGRGRLERASPAFRLIDVDVGLTNPQGDEADLKVTETFEILSPCRVMDLGLLSFFISEKERWYDLRSVTADDGSELPFVHRKDFLLLQLPRELQAGDEVTLVFRAGGEILFRPDRDAYWTLGTLDWLPLPTRLDARFFEYHAVVKVPKPFTPFSTGVTVRRWEEGGLACAEFEGVHPILAAVIYAGRHKLYEERRDGITIQIATYVHKRTPWMKEVANNLFSLIELYGELLGEFPYKELKVIELNEWGLGQAPPGIIFIGKETFRAAASSRRWIGINNHLAHELAHSWWGDLIPWAGPEDQWLSESTADYYAAVATGRLWKRERDFNDILVDWIQMSQYVKDHASLLLANQLTGPEGLRDRDALLYSKGPLVLHALRQELGDEAFFSAFRSLLAEFRHKHLTTKDAIAVINSVTEKDQTNWADRYILGTEWPDMKALRKKKSSK